MVSSSDNERKLLIFTHNRRILKKEVRKANKEKRKTDILIGFSLQKTH